MATLPSSIVFYAVLVAPGFVSVMTTVSLSAIEDDLKQFVLLVWSLVTSLVIDTVFLSIYQYRNGPLTSLDELSNVFFQPQFRADYVAAILGFSILVGIVYSAGILADLPGKLRRVLQWKMDSTYSPAQPWEQFMESSGRIRIKTSDDQLYAGDVIGWSRAERPREVRIADPYRYYNQSDDVGYEPVGGYEMIFFDDNIDRILKKTEDNRQSWYQRTITRLRSLRVGRSQARDDSEDDQQGSLTEEVADSVIRSFRWLFGGAAGGLMTYWITNDYSNLGLAVGAGILFLLSVGVDIILKTIVHSPE